MNSKTGISRPRPKSRHSFHDSFISSPPCSVCRSFTKPSAFYSHPRQWISRAAWRNGTWRGKLTSWEAQFVIKKLYPESDRKAQLTSWVDYLQPITTPCRLLLHRFLPTALRGTHSG